MITIKEAKSKKEMKQFVTFPFSLYKNNKYWVPPIIKDEIASFDKDYNPVFKQASARFFLAYKDNEIVGRVAAIINHTEVDIQKVKKMRFGWFDVIDDVDVSKTLLDKVYEIGKANNLEKIEGPIGFSNMDKVGILTKGYDVMGKMATWYNYPYYVNHLEKLGYTVGKEYLETVILLKNIQIEKYIQFAAILKKRYNYKVLSFTKSKDILPYVDEMFKIFEDAYSKLPSFVPISDEQVAFFKEKYISFINPEYVNFVVDSNHKIIAFGIIMPSFAEALQKANGKLFPFGFFHLLKAKKNHKNVVSYLIGIHPECQNKGVTAILFEKLYAAAINNKAEAMLVTPMLKSNDEIRRIWKKFQPETTKERCTYTLKID